MLVAGLLWIAGVKDVDLRCCSSLATACGSCFRRHEAPQLSLSRANAVRAWDLDASPRCVLVGLLSYYRPQEAFPGPI